MSKEDGKSRIEEGGVGTPAEVVRQVNTYLADKPSSEVVIVEIQSLRRTRDNKKMKIWRKIRKVNPSIC